MFSERTVEAGCFLCNRILHFGRGIPERSGRLLPKFVTFTSVWSADRFPGLAAAVSSATRMAVS